MSKTSMTIRMDEEIKAEAQALFNEMGMDMTTAINIFLRQTVRENRIPFEISVGTKDPFYNRANQNYLRKSLKSYQKGELQEHELLEVEE